MTYALAWPLQQSVFQLLAADPQVGALAGTRIYDSPPQASGLSGLEEIYIALGDERAEDWSTADGAGAVHVLTISIVAPRAGFAEAKQLAGAVSDAMLSATLAPVRGRVVTVNFIDARTLRAVRDNILQIEMRFRLALEDTA